MSEVWDRACQSDDNTIFGEEQGNFATLCFNQMKSNNVKRVLEIGSGHGIGTMFFLCSNSPEDEDPDYSSRGIDTINKKATEKKLPVNIKSLMSKSHYHFKTPILVRYITDASQQEGLAY